VAGLTLFILATNAWIYIDDNKYFYDFFFGSKGIVTAIIHVPNDLLGLLHATVTSTTSYYVLIVLVGISIAVMVYEALVAIGRVREAMHEVESEIRVSGLTYRQAFAERLPVWGTRLACALVWALYWLVFLQVLLPFGVVLLQNGIDSIVASVASGWLSILSSAAFVAVSFHMHVIFMRLITLRLRLFGSQQ
jgi:hypothetical protein